MEVHNIIYQIAIVAIPLLFAVSVHEASHGYMANRRGDPTARLLGRVTLNPFRHIDLMGTIIFPLLLVLANTGFVFGYAKPVPVNYLNMKDPKKDALYVALSGPLSNLSLALISGMLARIVLLAWPEVVYLSQAGGNILAQGGFTSAILVPVYLMLKYSVLINIILAVFNLIPIPPLDGGRVMMGILPDSQAALLGRLEPFGFIIIIGLVIVDPFGVWSQWVGKVMHWLIHLFMFG